MAKTIKVEILDDVSDEMALLAIRQVARNKKYGVGDVVKIPGGISVEVTKEGFATWKGAKPAKAEPKPKKVKAKKEKDDQ